MTSILNKEIKTNSSAWKKDMVNSFAKRVETLEFLIYATHESEDRPDYDDRIRITKEYVDSVLQNCANKDKLLQTWAKALDTDVESHRKGIQEDDVVLDGSLILGSVLKTLGYTKNDPFVAPYINQPAYNQEGIEVAFDRNEYDNVEKSLFVLIMTAGLDLPENILDMLSFNGIEHSYGFIEAYAERIIASTIVDTMNKGEIPIFFVKKRSLPLLEALVLGHTQREVLSLFDRDPEDEEERIVLGRMLSKFAFGEAFLNPKIERLIHVHKIGIEKYTKHFHAFLDQCDDLVGNLDPKQEIRLKKIRAFSEKMSGPGNDLDAFIKRVAKWDANKEINADLNITGISAPIISAVTTTFDLFELDDRPLEDVLKERSFTLSNYYELYKTARIKMHELDLAGLLPIVGQEVLEYMHAYEQSHFEGITNAIIRDRIRKMLAISEKKFYRLRNKPLLFTDLVRILDQTDDPNIVKRILHGWSLLKSIDEIKAGRG